MKPPPRRPAPGTITNDVYNMLDYHSGTAVRDMTGRYSYHQVHRALAGMLERGIVEKAGRHEHTYREVLWFRVGDNEHNNPFCHPPSR